ncbi:hypothetical protein EsH8_VIII_000918 [Colletotrichum jinshuiense]
MTVVKGTSTVPVAQFDNVELETGHGVKTELGKGGGASKVTGRLVGDRVQVLFHTDVAGTVPTLDGSEGQTVGANVSVEFQGAVSPVLLVSVARLLENPVDKIDEVMFKVGNGAMTVVLLIGEGKVPV